jgi:uncharacterized LabA/DUF88 family protein
VKVNIYIDGFNLYYCAVKDTSFRWLDLNKLCINLFPGKNFQSIYYFTAKIRAPRHDPDAPTRQEMYWRALKTIPNLKIVEGHFVRWPRWMPKFPLQYIGGQTNPIMVQVERTEEKGSDVNLAAMLVYHSCVKDFDEAIVISNDSDLALAIKLVTKDIKRSVIVVNPNRTLQARKYYNCRISGELKKVTTNYLNSINEKVLANSLFPLTLSDSVGTITKPSTW